MKTHQHPARPASPSRLRILIIGPSNVGDAILTSPVIQELSTRYAQAHVTLAVGERAKALFVEDPRIHTLVDLDRFASPTGRLTLAFALFRHRPQIVVDLRHTLYPILLKPLGAFRYLRQPPKTLVHLRDRYRWKLRAQVPDLARRERMSGEAQTPDGPPVWWSAKDAAHVDSLWRRWRLDGAQRVVVICPGARSHIKRWTPDGMARVADQLIEGSHAHIILSGEPDEKPVVEEILGRMRHHAHSAVGLTTIRQLGVLMRRAGLVITNDSASLHLASALQVPTVAIFGPTDAGKYGPTSPRSRTIRRRLFCAPCEQPLCRFSHECMRFISPEEVYRAAEELLGATHGPRPA